jgi:hypothetical protein
VNRPFRYAAFGTAAILLAVPALGQNPLGMLDRLQGQWELRVREPGGEVQRLCLQDGRRLIQLRHPGTTCDRLVVNDAQSDVTVQYTCPGRGYGRTHIRMETERLVQIDTQGIADGLPFSYTMEGRRVGNCAS